MVGYSVTKVMASGFVNSREVEGWHDFGLLTLHQNCRLILELTVHQKRLLSRLLVKEENISGFLIKPILFNQVCLSDLFLY